MSSENSSNLGTFKFYNKSVELTRSINLKYCVKCSHIMFYVIFSRRITERSKWKPEVVEKCELLNHESARTALAGGKRYSKSSKFSCWCSENSIVTQRKSIIVIFVVKNSARKRNWSHMAVNLSFALPYFSNQQTSLKIERKPRKES